MPTREEIRAYMVELILKDSPLDTVVSRAVDRFPDAARLEIEAVFEALVDEMPDEDDIDDTPRVSLKTYLALKSMTK